MDLDAELKDASARVLENDGIFFLQKLRAQKPTIELRWRESAALVDAYATLSEYSGEYADAIARIESAMPDLAPEIAAAASAAMGRLLAVSGSRKHASQVLAAAEASNPSDRMRARFARDRGIIACTERLWGEAARELRDARRLFALADDQTGILDAEVQIASVMAAQGNAGEAIDALMQSMERMPRGGILELRAILRLARMHLDRGELDKTEEYLERVHPLVDGNGIFEAAWRIAIYEAEIAWWQEDYKAARASIDLVRTMSVQASARLYETYAHYNRAMIEFDAGAFESALTEAGSAISLANSLSIPTIATRSRAIEGCALAALGRREEALAIYRTMRPSGVEGSAELMHHGMSAVAEIQLAKLENSEEGARRFLELATANIAKLVTRNAVGERWLEASLGLRLLGRRVRTYAVLAGLEKPLLIKPRPVAVLDDGSVIRLENGETISIEHRPVLQRLLRCLSVHASTHPGSAVTFTELASAAWPSDRASENSLRARLRVAMSTLRQLALGDALQARDGGYVLFLAGA